MWRPGCHDDCLGCFLIYENFWWRPIAGGRDDEVGGARKEVVCGGCFGGFSQQEWW